MNKWLRRIRGAIGMGLAWAAAWFGAGMVMMLGFLLITGSTGADVPYPLGFGLFGFFGGVLFSGFLGVAEGRRRFEEMSLLRFALWGGAGGLLLAVIFVPVAGLGGEALLLGPLFALAGAACASGSLALARMVERPGSLDAGTDAAKLGPAEDQVREGLGGGG
jgi:hypothetical protein